MKCFFHQGDVENVFSLCVAQQIPAIKDSRFL